MSVSRQFLFVFAILLWLFGGYKVLGIGFEAWVETASIYKYLWLLIALAFFMGLVFPKVVKANSEFILSLEGESFLWYKCQKPISWAIMIFMITLGICLRRFNLVPDIFIAGFYCGLGASLVLVALLFYGREIIRLRRNK